MILILTTFEYKPQEQIFASNLPSLLFKPAAVASLATRTCLSVAISSSVLVNSSFHCARCDSCSAADIAPKSPAITESVGEVSSGYESPAVASVAGAAVEAVVDIADGVEDGEWEEKGCLCLQVKSQEKPNW